MLPSLPYPLYYCRDIMNTVSASLMAALLEPSAVHPLPLKPPCISGPRAALAEQLCSEICAAYSCVVTEQVIAPDWRWSTEPDASMSIVAWPMSEVAESLGSSACVHRLAPVTVAWASQVAYSQLVDRYVVGTEPMQLALTGAVCLEAVLGLAPAPERTRPGMALSLELPEIGPFIELFSSPMSVSPASSGYCSPWMQMGACFGAICSASMASVSAEFEMACRGRSLAINPPFMPEVVPLVQRVVKRCADLGRDSYLVASDMFTGASFGDLEVASTGHELIRAVEVPAGRVFDLPASLRLLLLFSFNFSLSLPPPPPSVFLIFQ